MGREEGMSDKLPVNWKELILGTLISIVIVTLGVMAILEWMEG